MATIELRKWFFFSLASLHQAKFLSYGSKNYIIAFSTPKNIKSPNFVEIEQFVFSNDLPQTPHNSKNANFFYT